MPEVPTYLLGLFIFITITVWFLFRFALIRGVAVLGERKPGRAMLLSFLLGLWLMGTGMMAEKGSLQDFSQFPPMILVLVFMALILTFALAFSRVGLLVIEGAGLFWLVGFQSFRIAVEYFLHQMYLEGIVPIQMTYSGQNFDILAGLSAVIMAFQIKQKKVGPKAILIWNILGLALLLNIVVVAILSMPTPFRYFQNEPANTFVTYLPFVWLPVFHVQAALFGHLLVFRALKRGVTVT
jgi:hypothetical protein